ncbi:MAG: aconitase family protein, partial [Gemmatimonadaceae bacterium]
MSATLNASRRAPRTLIDKIWQHHVVRPESTDAPAVMFVDLHLVHEVTSPQAFAELRARSLVVRRPDLTVATMDHSTPTTPRASGGRIALDDHLAAAQLSELEANCRAHGIPLFPLGDERQGIVHVIGPEL